VIRDIPRALRNLVAYVCAHPIRAVQQAYLNAGPGLYQQCLSAVFLVVVALIAQFLLHMLLVQSLGLPEHGWIYRLVIWALFLLTLSIIFKDAVAPLLRAFGPNGADSHGSARFATPAEIRPLRDADRGLLIGTDARTGDLLRYAGPAHLLTIAPTRTGKGVGTIIPNLLTTERSVICIDPKGENARITGRARARFGPVHALDPFGITGQPGTAFNPLAGLKAEDIDVAEEAATLAEALVFDPPGQVGEAHWNEEAKALIAGLILHIVADAAPGERHLGTLREWLTLAPDDFEELLDRMQASTAASGLIARAANRHRGKSDREAAGVLSSAQRHTHFLDSPRMTTVLGRSGFRFADLKTQTATVFLVLPPDRLETYARWLRLMVTQSLLEMARSPAKPAEPVLYLLDEFAALGYLAPVERAMGLMAGYGVQLWPILQDVHQLRATYAKRAGSFFSNAAVLQVFGVNDHETAQLVSNLLGQQTVVFHTLSNTTGQLLSKVDPTTSESEQRTGRPLMTPDEVRNLQADSQLLFLAGQRPVYAGKLRYYSDRRFEGLFDPA
jgi:type IV secretion system protein VirD4